MKYQAKYSPLCAGTAGMFLFILFLVSATTAAEPFSLVVLGDTQYYASGQPPIYPAHTQWIVDHAEEYNVQAVIHMGDVTNSNLVSEWEVASAAHQTLEAAGIPYTVLPGNHDIYPDAGHPSSRNYTHYQSYFPASRFGAVSWVAGCDACSENNYKTLSVEGLDLLIVNLEFVPRKDALCWANDVIRNHPYHQVIVATHCYQNRDGARWNNCDSDYGIVGADADELWDELISRHSNIFLVLNGHRTGSVMTTDNTSAFANPVHQVLTDFQSEDSGRGWLRILTLYPEEDLITSELISTEGYTALDFLGPDYYPVDPEDPQHTFEIEHDLSGNTRVNYFDDGNIRFNDRMVNEEVTGDRLAPSVGVDQYGNSVVVWQDDTGINGESLIRGRGFYEGGCPRFSLTVNTAANGSHRSPAVSVSPEGSFVVVWEEAPAGDGRYQIFARGFDRLGNELFPDTVVPTAGTGQHHHPAVASDPYGRFVVAWEDDKDGNGYFQIMARGFDREGNARFDDIVVNSTPSGQQYRPAAGIDQLGHFVIAWEDDNNEDGAFQILARGFDSDGVERIPDFPVDWSGSLEQRSPVITMSEEGDFTVAWEDDFSGTGVSQITARGFYYNGLERFSARQINAVGGPGPHTAPALAGNPLTLETFVVWEDDNDNNGSYQILSCAIDKEGETIVPEMTVNKGSTGQQLSPSAAANGDGSLVVVWEDGQKVATDGTNILARGIDLWDYLVPEISSDSAATPQIQLQTAPGLKGTTRHPDKGNRTKKLKGTVRRAY